MCHLNLGVIFLFMGFWFIFSGLYYRLPVPIEPMKVVVAIAIAEVLTQDIIVAAGIILGVIFFSWGSVMEWWCWSAGFPEAWCGGFSSG
ncbi:MAG: putative sulfate/molybdate transporter [Methanomicrobiales archaeon]|nr:putative sulfate/molybdate transporter [Methanomicrobiales archaeon]